MSTISVGFLYVIISFYFLLTERLTLVYDYIGRKIDKSEGINLFTGTMLQTMAKVSELCHKKVINP